MHLHPLFFILHNNGNILCIINFKLNASKIMKILISAVVIAVATRNPQMMRFTMMGGMRISWETIRIVNGKRVEKISGCNIHYY